MTVKNSACGYKIQRICKLKYFVTQMYWYHKQIWHHHIAARLTVFSDQAQFVEIPIQYPVMSAFNISLSCICRHDILFTFYECILLPTHTSYMGMCVCACACALFLPASSEFVHSTLPLSWRISNKYLWSVTIWQLIGNIEIIILILETRIDMSNSTGIRKQTFFG